MHLEKLPHNFFYYKWRRIKTITKRNIYECQCIPGAKPPFQWRITNAENNLTNTYGNWESEGGKNLSGDDYDPNIGRVLPQ